MTRATDTNTSTGRPAPDEIAEACAGAHQPADHLEHALVGLWVDLLRTTNVLRARISQKLNDELGISPEEVELLMRLAAAPENRLRMVEVSNLLLVSKSGVTRLVDRLAQRGLVTRASCASDRRVVYTAMTASGAEILREAGPLFVAGLTEYLGRHLERHELEELREGLRRVLVGNGAWESDRRAPSPAQPH
jgi:DNA-binding MarR family transcriptional regulator